MSSYQATLMACAIALTANAVSHALAIISPPSRIVSSPEKHYSAITCQSPSIKNLPFCDRTLSFEHRADDLLSRMNTSEKIGQTGMHATAVPHLGIQSFNFGGEALHGVWATCVTDNISTSTHSATGKQLCPTQFPAPIHMGCSLNRDLWRAMADVASTEARALYEHNKLMNSSIGCSRSLEGCLGLSFYTPNVNLVRDPRWGRAEETPGEDPVINTVYAYEFTKGFQEGYVTSPMMGNGPYLKATVVVKHFAAYNVEVDLEHTDPQKWCGSPLNKGDGYCVFSVTMLSSKQTSPNSIPSFDQTYYKPSIVLPINCCKFSHNDKGGNCTLPNSRHSFNAHVSQRDLIETYTPAYRGAVAAEAGGIMCSYNAVNGEPMCTNRELIRGLLRESFGYNGIVATDCGALNDAVAHHHRFAGNVYAAAAALRAGVDSNCGSVFVNSLPAGLANGTVSEIDLDNSIRRLLILRLRLGLFEEDDASAPVPRVGIADVDIDAHRQLALQAAHEGIVLLQNSKTDGRRNGNSRARTNTTESVSKVEGAKGATAATLPLSPTQYKTVAMIGPNANASLNLLSGYHGSAPFLVSPLHAMQATWGASNVRYAVGCNVSYHPQNFHLAKPAIAEAVAVASAADVDVVVLGLGLCGDNYGGGPPKEDSTCFIINEAEGMDRANLTLPGPDSQMPGAQMELFNAIFALGKPVVVFIMNAGPLDISEIKNTGVPIVSAGYGGEYGGKATVDVLTGVYNPGGALTYTVYPQDFVKKSSFRDMTMRADKSTNNPGRTYRFLDTSIVSPVWPFGFGLSYTTFAIAFAQTPVPPTLSPGQDSQWVVTVTNTGHVPGGIAVLCYVSATHQSVVPDPPRRWVFDFARVRVLNPGEHTMVAFVLTAQARSLVNAAGVYGCNDSYCPLHGRRVRKCFACVFRNGHGNARELDDLMANRNEVVERWVSTITKCPRLARVGLVNLISGKCPCGGKSAAGLHVYTVLEKVESVP